MDRRLLEYYELELNHLRKMGAEFAREFPHVARRLSLEEFDCADPYVERLLEGFAFLACRVHLKLDSEFPRFTQAMLETVYPHYLAPTPSMAVVQIDPDHTKGDLKDGYLVPRDTVLRTNFRAAGGKAATTPCEYRTAHDVTLLPLEVVDAAYHTRDIGALDLPGGGPTSRAAIRIRLRTTLPGRVPIGELNLDHLVLHFRGGGGTRMRLYEQVFGRAQRLIVRPAPMPFAKAQRWQEVIESPDAWRGQVGFEEREALLPFDARSFQGYRLLKEYFTLPERFLFARIGGLAAAAKRCASDQIDLIITCSALDLQLEEQVTPENFALFCTPAVNLFPREADRIQLTDRFPEFPVIVDRTRPLDFEVYHVKAVRGIGASAAETRDFTPFYAARDVENDPGGAEAGGAYFSVNRVPRALTEQEQKYGRRSTTYAGSEVYVSLVDSKAAPYRSDLRQLAMSVLCTNRDLPLHIPPAELGMGGGNPGDGFRRDIRGGGGGDGQQGTTAPPVRRDFTWESGGPLSNIRWVSGPTPPRASWAEGDASWRLISHLCLNYLSLTDTDPKEGAAAIRELLRLYADIGEPQQRRQVEGVRSLGVRPVTRRVPGKGPVVFARGLEVSMLLEETAFEGSGVFLLGAILERFFARYVSLNSFTETVLTTPERGEVMRWPATVGTRNMI